MYAPVVPSKTIPDSRPKWAKCFQTKKAQKSYLSGRHTPSGRKNVMSMRELFCPDPQAGFEKMAGFQIFYCLKIRCFHS